METGPRGRSPQVQLITRAAALEALKGISVQMDGKGTTRRRTGTMNRARSAMMRSRRLAGNEFQKRQNIGHGDPRTNGLKINTRHSSLPKFQALGSPRNREEEPVLHTTKRDALKIILPQRHNETTTRTGDNPSLFETFDPRATPRLALYPGVLDDLR